MTKYSNFQKFKLACLMTNEKNTNLPIQREILKRNKKLTNSGKINNVYQYYYKYAHNIILDPKHHTNLP